MPETHLFFLLLVPRPLSERRWPNTTKPDRQIISLLSLSLWFAKWEHAVVRSILVGMIWWCILNWLGFIFWHWRCIRFCFRHIPMKLFSSKLLFNIWISLQVVEISSIVTVQQCLQINEEKTNKQTDWTEWLNERMNDILRNMFWK